MKIKAVSGIMLTLLVLGMLTLAFNSQLADAQTRKVGVKVGDWAKYEVAYNYTSNDPTSPFYHPEFAYIEHFKTEVLSVSGTNITFRATTYFENGTEVSKVKWIDISINVIALPSFFWGAILFTAANLTAGDTLTPNPSSDVINATLMRTYAGAEREVNFVCRRRTSSIIRATPPKEQYIDDSTTYMFWDRATGVLVEANDTTIYYRIELDLNNRPLPGGYVYVTKIFTQMTMKETKASETSHSYIYIRADGSVDPPTAPILSVDNVTYTFTSNINTSIVVERDNIVVDGAGYVIQGTGSETGILIEGDRYYPVRESNVTIKNMRIEAFQDGIKLVHCSKANISRTSITDNNFIGISLYDSHMNIFSENNVTGNGYGVELVHSGNNTFKTNNVVNNSWQALTLLGNTLWDFIQNIDTSNTVNGKPVYYWVNQRDKLVPNDAGYVALVNCSRILVQNLTFYRSGQGVLLAGTYNSVVENVVVSTDDYGIYMVQSNNITIRNNNIANCNMAMDLLYSHGNHIVENNIVSNGYGIEILWSTNNIISRNIIGYAEAPNGWGVSLEFSAEGNSISGNNITNNVDGIRLYESSNSSIFHNNFVNNTNQVYTYNSVNVWDDGYPSGGNYWSNYTDVDLFNGPDQNETGSDGIGDTAYVIDANNRDNYPLMGMFYDFSVTSEHNVQTICNSTISDFQFNGTAISFNVIGENDTSGFCRICIPTALMNDTYKVFVNDTEVEHTLLPCSNSTYSYLYFTYNHSTQEVVITPEFPTQTPIFIILVVAIVIIFIVVTVALTIYKRRLLKTPIH